MAIGSLLDADVAASWSSSPSLASSSSSPLVRHILPALSSALSPDQTERKNASDRLQSLTTHPGYYDALATIFSCRQPLTDESASAGASANLDREIKLQAGVQFKNGVDRQWRKTAINPLSAEEKAAIRSKLLVMVDEPERVLAKTVALSIGKIARLDYGTEWEQLPTSLLQSLKLGLTHRDPQFARLVVHRTLLYLHQTIKSLSSNRTMRGRTIMSHITDIVFSTVQETHTTTLNLARARLTDFGWSKAKPNTLAHRGYRGDDIEEAELTLLAFKILAKMTVYGFKDPSQDERARVNIFAFFVSTLASFADLFQLRHALVSTFRPTVPTCPRLINLTKLVISYCKLYRNLLAHAPDSLDKMGVSEQIVVQSSTIVQGASVDTSLISDEVTSCYPERLVVHLLLFIRTTLGDWASTSPLTSLPPKFAPEFAEILVTRLIPLRQVDLEKWQDDPEEWMNEEAANREEFELRPCAEYVLRSLLSHYKDELAPMMKGWLMRSISVDAHNNEWEALLLKEGVYCALGHSPADLKESIDFEHWLTTTLIPEARGTLPNERIIRRRIAWLVGNWVGEDLNPATRSQIYGLLVHLLGRNASTDQAIRLTAATSLAKCDTWDFDQQSFLPFLPSAIEEVVQLLGEVTLSDTQMRVNQALGVMIDRVGVHIAPYAPQLAEILASLWSSTAENHFQVSVLVTLTKLVEALGDKAQALHAQICPIIQHSADPSSPSHVYLQEDGLELWHALLKRSNSLSPELVALIPLLINLISAGTDVLPRCLAILESYLLLDGPQILRLCSSDLLRAFSTVMGDHSAVLKFEPTKVILHGLTTVFQTCPIELWAANLDDSAVFIKLWTSLRPQTEDRREARTVTRYLLALARIVLAGPETFFQLIEASAARAGLGQAAILEIVVVACNEKLDFISSEGHRKLIALALASLTSSCPPPLAPTLHHHFVPIVSTWCSVLAQTEEDDLGDAELYEVESDAQVDYVDTLEASRRGALARIDPVRSVKVATFISQQLGTVVERCGGLEGFRMTWLSAVGDGEILSELEKRLNGTLAG
ncbi:BQ2448_689 [Microbotryum intermedium]|uniref:BQ2448_689 protein n=1 Tax=Microbotryum intermedium TaxID=269621 RepID=A0A238FBQ1_9BASI|nr:BQ2448_689 [Microbotryum intermedium]